MVKIYALLTRLCSPLFRIKSPFGGNSLLGTYDFSSTLIGTYDQHILKNKMLPNTRKKKLVLMLLDDFKNHQWIARSSRTLEKTCETETKKTLQRVLVWYQTNTLRRLSKREFLQLYSVRARKIMHTLICEVMMPKIVSESHGPHVL